MRPLHPPLGALTLKDTPHALPSNEHEEGREEGRREGQGNSEPLLTPLFCLNASLPPLPATPTKRSFERPEALSRTGDHGAIKADARRATATTRAALLAALTGAGSDAEDEGDENECPPAAVGKGRGDSVGQVVRNPLAESNAA